MGDSFPLEERAKVQGLFSGVWGISSLLGPVVGGLIVDHADWRWVFYINAPFGLISIALIIVYFKEQVEQKKRQIDYVGAATLSGAIVVLLFALLQGGTTWAWNSLPSIGLFVLAAVLLGVFVIQELRFPEPVLPMTLFTDRTIVTANIGNAMLGVIMFSISSYVTLFMQGARGETATNAGLALIPYLFSWSITATFSAKVILRYGFRVTALLGCLLAAVGVALTLTFQVGSSLYVILFSMLLIGAGFGFSSSTYTLSVQNHVPWNLRGVATASGQFFRTIGGTVGVAVMGTVLNAQMAQNFTPIFRRFSDAVARLPKDVSPSNLLLKPEVRSTLPVAFVTQLQTALANSLFWIYALMFFVAVIGLLAAFWLPAGKIERKPTPQEAEPAIAG